MATNFRSLEMIDCASPAMQKQRVVGFQRRHSLCPVTLPNSKFNSSSTDSAGDNGVWPLTILNQQWTHEHQQLPRSSLNHIPFRVDRSVSMIEGHVSSLGEPTAQPLPPPPGLNISSSSLSTAKTELCRTYEESAPPCRTFHTIGFCPYGARCHFIHNADEQHSHPESTQRQKPRERPQLLRQSVSFAGFSSQALTGFQALTEPLAFSRAASVSPPPSTGSPDLLSPLFSDPGNLKYSYRFSADLGSDTPRFYAAGDPKAHVDCAQNLVTQNAHRSSFTFTGLAALQRTASADSLSDQEGYSSSSSLSGCDSPGIEGRRLPIFSRLSVSDD
uniref:mRNA decay activator protein ZFP36 n=1 Tax=Electrophorus electricus TaxID=8005 RepID=A0AAY5EC79_ELEEL